VPDAERSLDAIWAVNTPLLTNVVVRGLLFQRTCDAGTKLSPPTVRVNPGLPAPVADGAVKVITGAGFAPAARTPNGRMPEVPPPGADVITDTEAVSADVTSLAGTVAMSSLLLTKVVGRELANQCTTELGENELPVTVMVN
jgi:hypothetical protein